MIRAILVTSILTLFAVPALAQNTTAEEACHATEFIQENNLSAIYVGESAQVALNAQLGSMASCTVKLKLKPCLYTTVKRAGSYVKLYNRGQSLFNGLRMLFGILESTGWNYKVESSLLSISFRDVQFGDFVSNEIAARSQFIFGGASMDLDKLQEIMKDETSWNELCSIGTMTEDNFKTAWDVAIKKADQNRAAEEERELSKMKTSGDVFGAIAHGPRKEQIGYSTSEKSRESAEREALDLCGTDCTVRVWFVNSCGAYAQGETHGWGAAHASSGDEAFDKALAECGRQSEEQCRVRATVCTNGHGTTVLQ